MVVGKVSFWGSSRCSGLLDQWKSTCLENSLSGGGDPAARAAKMVEREAFSLGDELLLRCLILER